MLRVSRRHVLIGCALAPFAARAAGRYPDRPIRVIIPYTAGGLAETIMRLLAVSMEPRLGQKLVIEAKPGAAGNIGTQEVARAEPDGYEILVAATNNFVINQFLLKMTLRSAHRPEADRQSGRCAAGAVFESGCPGAYAGRVHRLRARQPRQTQLRHPERRDRQSPADRAPQTDERDRASPMCHFAARPRRCWHCSRMTFSSFRSV